MDLRNVNEKEDPPTMRKINPRRWESFIYGFVEPAVWFIGFFLAGVALTVFLVLMVYYAVVVIPATLLVGGIWFYFWLTGETKR